MPTILIRRRTEANATWSNDAFQAGELLHHDGGKTLYIRSAVENGTVPVGGIGAFVALTYDQTIGGKKTFSGNLTYQANATDVGGRGNFAVINRAYLDSRLTGVAGTEKTVTLAGAVTGSGTTGPNSSITTTLSDNVVTNSKLADMAAVARIKGSLATGTDLGVKDLNASQVREAIEFQTTALNFRLDQFAVPTANLSINNNLINNLAEPFVNSDAATKGYVDSQFATATSGLDYKESCRVATTESISLTAGGLLTIDGVALQAGDRVLVKNQSNASENGIYVAAVGEWSRSTDADTITLTSGAMVFITDGQAGGNIGKSFVLSTKDPFTVGSDDLSFVQYQGSSVPGGFPLGLEYGGTGNSDLDNAGNYTLVYKDHASSKLLPTAVASVPSGAFLTGGNNSAPAWTTVIDGGTF